MAEFPDIGAIIGTPSNAEQKANFEKWLNATRQLPGARVPQTYTLSIAGGSGSFVPETADCLIDLPGEVTNADLVLAPPTGMAPGNILALRLARDGITVKVKSEVSGLPGRFSTNNGNDISLSSTNWMTFQLVDGAWQERGSSGGGGGDGTPILSIVPSTTGLPILGYLDASQDNGWLDADAFPGVWDKINQMVAANTGAVVSVATWEATVAQHGLCGKYCQDVPNRRFRIPLLRKRASWGLPDPSVGAAVGDYLPDQMRPITGQVGQGGADSGGMSYNASRPLRTSGAFKTDSVDKVTGGFYPATTNQSRDLVLDSALLGPNYSGDISHGRLVILTPMLKMYGAPDDPGLLNAAAVVQMIAAKLDTSVFEQIPFRNVWVSGEYAISGVSPHIINATHNLNLQNPEKALGDALLVCKVAEYGYQVGETAQFSMYSYDSRYIGTQVYVGQNVLRIQGGAGYTNGLPGILRRDNSYGAVATAANWRYVFRIFY